MPDSRIDDLRRRLREDPASIAFAQLAEEHRRAGEYGEAIRVCREGLERHPGYASARVTLARALAATGDLDAAEAEFQAARHLAPDHLAAIRGLADLYQRRGRLNEALAAYRDALGLARADPDLQTTVAHLAETLRVDLRPAGPVAVGQMARPSTTEELKNPGIEELKKEDALQQDGARRTLAVLERWLDAILGDRRPRE